MTTILKNITIAACTTLLLLFATLLLTVYVNNKEAAVPTNEEIQLSFEDSIQWLTSNEKKIMNPHSSSLWSMLKQASEISEHPTLKALFQKYKKNYLDRKPRNIWTPIFEPDYKPDIPDIVELFPIREYQLFLLYGLTCDSTLGREPLIIKQKDADYCPSSLRAPSCATHQLMAVRLLQKRECGEHSLLKSALLDKIESQLFWDFRVADAYLQRAWMLVDSGRKLNPTWLRRILKAQKQDGGWTDFHPLISIGNRE